jgi:hypothetical protein
MRRGNYQFTGEFIDHCFKFEKGTLLTRYEVEYIENHQEEIRNNYARLAISDYLHEWLDHDRLYDKVLESRALCYGSDI